MTQTTTPILLLTRPAPDSERFLRALGPVKAEVVVSPLVRIEAVAHDPLPEGLPLVLTSANAVSSLKSAGLAGRTAYCVGARTADAAAAAGMTAISADGVASDLVRLIVDRGVRGELLYLRGQEVSFDLASALRDMGLSVSEAVVYRQVEAAPTDEACAAIASPRPTVCPVFSAASLRRLMRHLTDGKGPVTLVAISEAVFRSFPPTGAVNRCISDTPDMAGMVAAVRVALKGAETHPSLEGPEQPG